VNPVQLYYECYGQGDPLLCLHGFGASLFSWRNFIEPFSKDHQLILIDLKGHGKSPKPNDSEYSIIDHATLVRQFILDHDLRNLTLIGNSLGGAISLLVTIMLMDLGDMGRLRSIMLIDSGAYGDRVPSFLKLLALPVIDLFAYLVPSRVAAKKVLQQAYYDQRDIPTWTTEHPYETPLAPLGRGLPGREIVHALDDALDFSLLRFILLLVVLALRKEGDGGRTYHEDDKRKPGTPLLHKA